MNVIRYVPEAAVAALAAAAPDPETKAGILAAVGRINCLYMIQKAGSGHIGTSFSSMEIVTWLHFCEMTGRDIFFSSKGHDAPAIYTTLIHAGRMPFEKLHALRRLGGLPGHPDVSTPGMATNTGSLGMGISKARGMAMAGRMDGESGRIFVLLGDGELQEGQIYESLQPTANGGFAEITAIVDHNKIQSDTWVQDVSDLGEMEEKFAAFGWATARCDGNDIPALARTLRSLQADNPGRPKVLIADTVKGKGVSFMEQFDAEAANGLYPYHSGALGPDAYAKAFAELDARLKERCREAGLEAPSYEEADLAPGTPPKAPQRLIGAYSAALKELGDAHENMVVLDADLALDCGLLEFRAAHRERFIECGIAEQDMVSMAGGLALSGKLPLVHSFGCFLSTRPNEQIFNNATERTKIIYTGSLVGLCPAGPGHSHQSVRDIALMSCVPGMTCIEPSCEAETAMALRWAVERATGSVYLRLVSIPCPSDFALPQGYRLEPGKGCVLREGTDAVLVGYGPVLLQQAWLAAEQLTERGLSVKVVNLPWLNTVDQDWFTETVRGIPRLLTLDNHLLEGGQGQRLAAICARLGLDLAVKSMGLADKPVCGTNDQALAHHGLDAQGIAASVEQTLAKA